MPFKVAARTILQLGSELISSDSVAFYELIKNGFDAGSRRIEIEFLIRVAGDLWDDCDAALSEMERRAGGNDLLSLDTIKRRLIESIDRSAPNAASLVEELQLAPSVADLRITFQRANTITVRDRGAGMSMAILADAFLTIGTRYRRAEREGGRAGSEPRVTLGDKGVGRLSVMRLGSQMLVATTQRNEPNWHELRIDWEMFSHDSDALLAEIPIGPTEGTLKDDPNISGTELYIWGLSHSWTLGQVEELCRTEFSRFTDPFAPAQSQSVRVTFNSSSVTIPRFDKLLFDNAHATLKAAFSPNGSSVESEAPSVAGAIDYTQMGQMTDFRIGPLDLASIAKTPVSVVRDIGPFQLELHWWNRRILRAIEGIGDRKLVRSLLDRWSGGVSVYRDGYRVNPYGATDDDWLGLDKDAFRAPGYKLNRGQIVAKITISRDANPYLVDQTNREGLQHNVHFLALRAVVKHILEVRLREFLDEVDKRDRLSRIESVDQLESRTKRSGQRVRASLRQLRDLVPSEVTKVGILDDVEELLKDIDRTFSNARLRVQNYREERERLIGLAGTGLLVELVAHELNRATTNALKMVSNAVDDPTLAPAHTVLTILGAQLRTLRTRLSVLDDMSTSGRQVKTSFDFVNWVRNILENHQPQFDRHGIGIAFQTKPETAGQMNVKMVRGMVVQILENLLSNSIYWLAVQKRDDPGFEPRIWVTIDLQARSMTFTDNGPGIDKSQADDVFRAFVTTKPPGEGSGLGLYIAREVANYHKAILRLSSDPTIHTGKLNTFILSLANVET